MARDWPISIVTVNSEGPKTCSMMLCQNAIPIELNSITDQPLDSISRD